MADYVLINGKLVKKEDAEKEKKKKATQADYVLVDGKLVKATKAKEVTVPEDYDRYSLESSPLSFSNLKKSSGESVANRFATSNPLNTNLASNVKKEEKKLDQQAESVSKAILGTDKEPRDANFWDVTWRSIEQGYANARLGEETYKHMYGEKNDRQKYADILASDEYNFAPSNWFEEGVSGAAQQIGQMLRQYTHPRSLAAAGTAAGAAALAGQAGPQVLVPEELISVPAAALAGFAAGGVASNLEIEAGHAYNEMIEAGLSEETSRNVALGVGGVNAALEMLQVDELLDAYRIVKGGASKSFTKKLAEILLDRGIDVATETVQEVAQEGVTIAGTQFASKAEKGEWAYSADQVGERLKDTAVSSALTFGMLNVPATATNISSAAGDYKAANTLSKDEQAVYDKVVEDLIVEKEKDGAKITAKEKSDIKKKARHALEDGTITVDEIEKVLGGEAYNEVLGAWKALSSTEDYKALKKAEADKQAIEEEYEEFVKNGTKDLAENDRFNELHTQMRGHNATIKGLLEKLSPETTRIVKMRNAMRGEVSNRVKDSRLAESYREFERSKQKFEVDIEKYTDESSRKTVQAILDSGVGDNSNAFHNQVDLWAKLSEGRDLTFKTVNNEMLKGTKHYKEGYTTHGFKIGNEITLNMDSDRVLNTTVGHEITHVLEQAGVYEQLSKTAIDFVIAKEGQAKYDARLEEAREIYKDDDGTTPEMEVVADIIGEYVFSDYDFVQNLVKTDRNVFERVWDEIKYMAKIATAGSKEARQLERVKKMFEKAWRETSEVDGSTKYSLENGNKRQYNKSKKSWYSQSQAEFMSWSHNPSKIGQVRSFNRNGKTRYYEKTEDGCVELSRAQYNERSGIDVRKDYEQAKSEISEAVNYDESTRRDLLGYYDGNRDTSGDAVVFGQALQEEFSNVPTGSASSTDGYNRGTDVTEYSEEASDNSGASFVTFSNDYAAIRNHMKEGDTGESDAQYSMSKDAAKVDKNYFEAIAPDNMDAVQKMVNDAAKEAGYTINAYHGTKDSFTVFERGQDNQYDSGYLGSGFYFTDKRETAEDYSNWKKGHNAKQVMNVALRMEKPLVIEDTSKPHLIAVQEALGLHLTDFGNYLAAPNKEISDAITNEAKKQGYDGIIRYSDAFDETTYVVFDSNQVKSTDPITYADEGNIVPLSERFNMENEDVRFSLSKAVEEDKNLVALHNLTEDKLLKSLELGGLPMPSIAITKADIPHENFGEITLILGKDSIDPKANKKNVVYSADAWTPTFPRVEYEADTNVEKRVNKKLLDLATKVEDAFKHDIDMLRYSHEDNLNRYGGEEGYIQYLMGKYGLKAAYLEDKGIHIEKVTQQVEEAKKFNPANADKYQKVIDILGVESATELGKYNLKDAKENHGEELEAIYPGITQSALRMGKVFGMVQAYMENKDSDPVYRTVTDENAMREAVDEALDAEGYEAWVRNLFNGIVGNSGIYNNKDLFTPSGSRRTFKQTHLPFTLENIVKAMASQNNGNTKNIAGFNGVKTLRAGTAERFKSIQAMHDRKGRLQNLTQEEFDKIHDDLQTRLFKIIETIDNETGVQGESNPYIRYDSIGEILTEIGEGGKYNVADIQKVFAEYSRNIDDDLATDIKQLLFDVSEMPVNIYEAKPERAVSFDEVGVFVIPRNADAKLKQELLNRGYSIAEYDPDVEGDRNKVVNQFEEYRFSLTPVGNEPNASGIIRERGVDFGYNDPLGDLPIKESEPMPGSVETTIEESVPYEDIPAAKEDTSPAKEITTVQEKIQQKIANTQAELDKNRQYREQSFQDYNEEIARLQEKYDSKKNKTSLTANGILRSIERMKRIQGNIDADYAKRISDLEARVEKMSSPEYSRAEHRRAKMAERTEFWANLIGDTSTWKDMAIGLAYKTKTLRRILRHVVRDANGKPDIGLADHIYDELETKYDHNEASLKKESKRLKERFFDMKLTHAEDTYAHMLGEFRHNPETTLTEDVVKEYYEKHKKKIDTKKVDSAIEEARKTFDDLIVRVNEALRENGFKEIPYRQGYFPHFTNPKQNWLQKAFNWKPVDNEIPTSIAGLTETFKPQRSWQSFDKQRKGDTTDYSLYQGLDTYIHGALDWIYHIDDLQSRRALENHIRYIHSEEGVQKRIDEIKANETYSADEAQDMIDAVLAEASNPLGGLVRELMDRTNTLANKKAAGDRKMESDFNRKVYSTMTNLNNRINANMVVGSFSSALTNFIPMVQSWHQVSPYFTVRGLGDMIRSTVRDDGMIAKSDFLTNRLVEEEKLYQTGWDKVSDKAGWLMNVVDSITSQTVWRSKYLQNLKEGMSENAAIKDADQFAKNLMAGRSRGNAPSIFDEKNPVTKIFTAFQLEVANQYGYMFEDVPQDSPNKARMVKGYAMAFLGAYAYNALYSSLVGRDAAFDPISIIEDLLKDMFGDDEEKEPEEVLMNLGENIAQEVPFVGGLLGGGRIPLSSVLPYSGDSTPFESMLTDVTEGNWDSFGKEFLKPLYYLAMPVGGGQLKKIVEGLSMFDDDLPISGSYTDSGKLRFPVEKNVGNVIQAGLFGQYASKNAREYFDEGYAPLGEKQIEEYKNSDLPISDYWKYREGLKGLDKLGEKADYIDSLDLPISTKNYFVNNIADRKEPIDMRDYGKYSSFEEFDFASKNPDKYEFFENEGISYQEYASLSEKKKDAWNSAWEWAKEKPDQYKASKVVTDDVIQYREYTSTINAFRADKDKNGKSINGTAKQKKVDYINSLDLEYGKKLILYRDVFPTDSRYNKQILEYVNGRNDLTFEDKVSVLRGLDFRVDSKGNVSWD